MGIIETFVENTFVQFIDILIGLLASFLAAIFSGINWWNNRKKKERDEGTIDVILECADYEENHRIPVPLTRGALSRAELFGLIGSVPRMDGKKFFKINELLKNKFWEEKFKPVLKGIDFYHCNTGHAYILQVTQKISSK